MTTIDHVGIAVHNLSKAENLYRLLGLEIGPTERIEQEAIRIAMIRPQPTATGTGCSPADRSDARPPAIEIMEPLGEDSAVYRFLARRGEGLHHIALRVDDLGEVLRQTKEHGVKLVSDGIRRSQDGSGYFFIHPSGAAGVLIEVCQARADDRGRTR